MLATTTKNIEKIFGVARVKNARRMFIKTFVKNQQTNAQAMRCCSVCVRITTTPPIALWRTFAVFTIWRSNYMRHMNGYECDVSERNTCECGSSERAKWNFFLFHRMFDILCGSYRVVAGCSVLIVDTTRQGSKWELNTLSSQILPVAAAAPAYASDAADFIPLYYQFYWFICFSHRIYPAKHLTNNTLIH